MELSDMVVYPIEEKATEMIRYYAKNAEIGGRSRIHGNRDVRNDLISKDQLVGQLCNYALIMYLTGREDLYVQIREEADENPHQGDQGIDVPGHKIDIKGRYMHRGPDPMTYSLPVRPKERHRGYIYVLGLVPSIAPNTSVNLMGWVWESDMTRTADRFDDFRGAYMTPLTDLHPMRDLVEQMHSVKVTVGAEV